jgi:hypothetical protein
LETVFSTWSMQKGYKEDNWGNKAVLYGMLWWKGTAGKELEGSHHSERTWGQKQEDLHC